MHGVDVSGSVVLRKRLSRGQVERFFAALAPAVLGEISAPVHQSDVAAACRWLAGRKRLVPRQLKASAL